MASAQVEQLMGELSVVGLTEAHARRLAFCALAHRRGWTPAQIARWLGISRQRAGQKVDQLREYAESRPMPCLRRLLHPAPSCPVLLGVGFTSAHWDDPEFAYGVLELLA